MTKKEIKDFYKQAKEKMICTDNMQMNLFQFIDRT